MHAAIIIPCLNEEENIAATCASLGFGGDRTRLPDDTTLILVDNGSTDSTAEVIDAIRSTAPDKVITAHESERGYVPPRHHGVLIAIDEARNCGYTLSDVLVLQADADTRYNPGYIDAMRNAASGSLGAIVEGVARTSADFLAEHPGFHALADEADRATAHLAVDESAEVIIDDQVAAYRLDDYMAWGGHRREFDQRGDEIHAETSRLFLRGKMMGATRVRVGEAVAFPSRRKVELDPLLYFATMGFPREATWRRQWRAAQGGPCHLDAFEPPQARTDLTEAIFMRHAHNLILFGLMPAYVARLIGYTEHRGVLDSPLGDLAAQISEISAADLASNPGCLFEASFPLINSHRHVFDACIRAMR